MSNECITRAAARAKLGITDSINSPNEYATVEEIKAWGGQVNNESAYLSQKELVREDDIIKPDIGLKIINIDTNKNLENPDITRLPLDITNADYILINPKNVTGKTKPNLTATIYFNKNVVNCGNMQNISHTSKLDLTLVGGSITNGAYVVQMVSNTEYTTFDISFEQILTFEGGIQKKVVFTWQQRG